jgi:hypothetical protein
MALKFSCNHCDTEIISKFLKVGEEAKCKFCDTSTLIPDNAEEVDDNEYDKYTTKLKKVKIAPSVNNDKPATIKQSEKLKYPDLNTISGPKTLSEKYDNLEIYQYLAVLLMIVATGFFIYSLVDYFDLPKVARKILEYEMIKSTVLYFTTMFSLFCLTKIIDYLFDLDKKTDNNV